MDSAERWGVAESYEDYKKNRVSVAPRTRAAVLDALGAAGEPPEAGAVVASPARPPDMSDVLSIEMEDGGSSAPDVPAASLPFGYHSLVYRDGRSVPFIWSPGLCHGPEGERSWGVAVQLYSLYSDRSRGIGDLGDLRDLTLELARLGAGAVLISPIGSAGPGPEQQTSPYFPSSRCFRSPLYLRTDAIASVPPLPGDSSPPRRIDRAEVLSAKMAALEAGFAAEPDPAGIAAYRERSGRMLRDFATYMSIAESLGPDHRTWPRSLEHPGAPGIDAWVNEHLQRIAFHEWIQFHLDEQLRAASGSLDLMNDLPVGVDPGGADAWMWKGVFAEGVTIGAPPDEFNSLGQNWALPPLDPWKLRASGYEAFLATIRAAFASGGGIRIDHVMGLFRLWWIPEGNDPADGTYVRYPHADLLDIVALESHRTQSLCIGEDLGTVEDVVRDELRRRNMLSYKLLLFEEDQPSRFDVRSLAAATNHDLPTIAGLWDGTDVDELETLGLSADAAATKHLRASLAARLELSGDEPAQLAIDRAHEAIAGASSALALATLEDALGVEHRPNVPGTNDDARANWSQRLPMSLEEIVATGVLARLAETLRRDAGGAVR